MRHSSPGLDFNFCHDTGMCSTVYEFPGRVDCENVHGQKKNWHPSSKKAKNCPKNAQNFFGPKSGIFCCLKVVGNRILSGKYIKTIFVSLSVQKLRPIQNRHIFEQIQKSGQFCSILNRSLWDFPWEFFSMPSIIWGLGWPYFDMNLKLVLMNQILNEKVEPKLT